MTSRIWPFICGVMVAAVACGKSDNEGGSLQTVGRQPDVAPVMLNKELPFRYPPALFAQKVQGNVTLRIFIDRSGQIVSDSTHVAETSGFTALDSAAVRGSRELKFIPAKTQGQPVPVSILLPVFFRHPGAPPLPGDTVLKGRSTTSTTAASVQGQAPAPIVDSVLAPAVKVSAKRSPARPKNATTSSRTRKKRR